MVFFLKSFPKRRIKTKFMIFEHLCEVYFAVRVKSDMLTIIDRQCLSFFPEFVLLGKEISARSGIVAKSSRGWMGFLMEYMA